MRVINKLTNPGGIRRVDLTYNTVRIVLVDGTERTYTANNSKGGNDDGHTDTGIKFKAQGVRFTTDPDRGR